jgi:hypothetical protein
MEKSFDVLARQLSDLTVKLQQTTDREERKELLIWMRLVMGEIDEVLGIKRKAADAR